MDERLCLVDRDKREHFAWAALEAKSGREAVDGILEPADRITFTIHSTAASREFLRDRTAMEAYATRSMPDRRLDVESVIPTPDRAYLLINCRG